MKVVKPSDESHKLILIPRLYETAGVVFTLINETTKAETDISVFTITNTAGVWELDFDFTFEEGDKYVIKLENATEVLYRGRILATEQDVEDYDVTEGYYTYG